MRLEQSRHAGRMMMYVSAVTASALAVSAQSAQLVDDPALKHRVESNLLLLKSELATLDFDSTPGARQEIAVPVGQEDVVIQVWPHSVRTANYLVRVQVADGSYTDVAPSPMRTVRGTIKGMGGAVIGSVDENGLTARIILSEDESYWVEPVAGRFAGATPGMHVIYKAGDALPGGGTCAMAVDRALANIDEDSPLEESAALGCDGLPCEVQLGVDADFEFFSFWGTIAATEARINAVINGINFQYEIEVGLVHKISAIIIRTSEPDPYSTTDGGTFLGQLQTQWQQNHQDIVRDEVQLFTGKFLDPPPIGIALTIGGICTGNAYCLVMNETNNFACTTDLSAHELGHLWGGQHCACAGNTMNPSLTCSNRFGPLTIPSLVAHRESRACLTSRAPAITFPFSDQFNGGPDLDPAKWYAVTATIDDQGSGEPSAPTSLRIRGLDRATTGFMDASSVTRLGVEYFWQRTGLTGGSPEPGEDLLLEYKALDGQWREGDRQFGDGADNLPYARACALLPEDADLAKAQIRFRFTAAQSSDNFFVDNVRILNGAEFLDITSQPEFGCACLHGTAHFSVAATGEGPLSYQWKRHAIDIPGATGPTLAINNVAASDFDTYTVAVSNACGTILSAEVELMESFAPAFTLHPQDTVVSPGGTLGMFVATSGGCGTFQWFLNDVPIAGATSGFLFIPDMQCANQGCYHVVVTNDCGSADSDVATVTVEGCGPVDCDADSVPPVVVHAAGLADQTRPYSGYIDPRRESSNGVNLNQGLTQFDVRFSEPVERIGGGALDATSFAVTETGAAAPPSVMSVNSTDMPVVHVTLSRPITLREWTTIRANVQDMADPGNVIINVGNMGPGVNESDRVDIGFLPGDIDQTSVVNPLDLLKFKQYVNMVQTPPLGTVVDFIDTNRSGGVNPLDLLAFKQLINGVNPPATTTWAGKTMLHARP